MKDEKVEEQPVYIQPNIEYELSKEKRMECREILQEIRKFGVSQRQMLYLIQLLALDLENREIMTGITKVLGEKRSLVPVDGKSKLITNTCSQTTQFKKLLK